MADFVACVDRCQFPLLRDDEVLEPGKESFRVSLPKSLDIWDFCDEQSLSPYELFLAVWALVLRIYVGNDSVSSGFLQLDVISRPAWERYAIDCDKQTTGCRPATGMLACCARFTCGDRTPSSIRSNLSFQVLPEAGSRPFNTLMIHQEWNRPQETRREQWQPMLDDVRMSPQVCWQRFCIRQR